MRLLSILKYTNRQSELFQKPMPVQTLAFLLKERTSYASAHQAGDGAANQSFGTQFGEVPALPGCQLTNAADLYTNRCKVGKAGKSIRSNKNRLWIGKNMAGLHGA